MEPVRGTVRPPQRPVSATWFKVDGAVVIVKSDGNCSIDNFLSKERGVICCLELDMIRVLATFAERLAGHSGVDANSKDALEGFRIGPQPEGCSPLVLFSWPCFVVIWQYWRLEFVAR